MKIFNEFKLSYTYLGISNWRWTATNISLIIVARWQLAKMIKETMNDLTQFSPTVPRHPLKLERPSIHESECFSWCSNDWDPNDTGQLVNKTCFTYASFQKEVYVFLKVGMGLHVAEDRTRHQSVRLQQGVRQHGCGEVTCRWEANVPVKII